MLSVPKQSGQFFTYDNWVSNPSSTPGTSVTPGSSNAQGSWTQVASSSNIANDVYGIYIQAIAGAATMGVNTPKFVLPLPANATASNGVSAVIPLSVGIAMNSGIKMGVTTAATGNSVVSSGVTGLVYYK